MGEYLYVCPVCKDTVLLGNIQINRKMCPSCRIKQEQNRILEEHRRISAIYKAQRNRFFINTPVRRPLTETQLADALLDAKSKIQLEQCKKCRFSCGKGINLFCDYITEKKRSRNKGSGPGDCRSFIPRDPNIKIDRRKPLSSF